MLVQHDVEAEFVGELPFVVIAVEQLRRADRIEFAVGQIHPQRTVMVVPDVGIGLLGELKNSHLFLPLSGQEVENLVRDRIGLFEMREMPGAFDHCKRALRKCARHRLRPYSGATMRSASPHSTSVGMRIRCSRAFSFGSCM